jgi:glycosyltransferase involved in cell wall biosynthesis
MNPRFSVIITTYDRPGMLEEAVSSVLSQTVPDFECLVVDDASPIPVRRFDDERVRVIRRSANGGHTAAMNTGLDHASGEAILFLDDDDVFMPDRLELAAEGLRRAPVAICWSRFMGEPWRAGRRLEGDVSDVILDSTTPQTGTVAIRRDVMEPFDEAFVASQDVEWWLRMAERQPVATVPQIGLEIRRHPGVRNLNGPQARIRSSLKLLDERRDYFGGHPRAAAFRWKRIGLTAIAVGDSRTARRAFLRSLTLHPSVKTAWHLSRAVRPTATGITMTEAGEMT